MKPLEEKKKKDLLELASVLLTTDAEHYFDGHLTFIFTLLNSLAIFSKAFWPSSVNSTIKREPSL